MRSRLSGGVCACAFSAIVSASSLADVYPSVDFGTFRDFSGSQRRGVSETVQVAEGVCAGAGQSVAFLSVHE